MSETTVYVHSEKDILLEIGLEKGIDLDQVNTVVRGRHYRNFQVKRGLNSVPADIAREWFRVNRRFLECIRDGKIRIVTATELVSSQLEITA